MLRRRILLTCLVVLAAGCGGAQGAGSGQHSAADVRTALDAVGMKSFKTISKAEIRSGKQEPGVDSSKFLGGFSYSRERGSAFVAITVAVVTDTSVFKPMEREIASEGKGMPERVRFVRTGNVLISSIRVPAGAKFSILADIPKLSEYLRAH